MPAERFEPRTRAPQSRRLSLYPRRARHETFFVGRRPLEAPELLPRNAPEEQEVLTLRAHLATAAFALPTRVVPAPGLRLDTDAMNAGLRKDFVP